MERQKHIYLTLLLVYTFSFALASNRSEIYQAYLSKDMGKWKQIIDRMEKETPKTDAFLLELINYQYGYIGWCLGTDRKKEAEKYLDSVEKNAYLLEDTSYKLSYVNAYKAAFYGFRMGLAFYKAPILGPKSLACCKMAMQLDKTNPFGFLQYGNALYYQPKLLGGSKTLALTYYLKAEKLMEESTVSKNGDWNYLNLLAIIGLRYQEMGQPEMAKKYYEKAIRLEPHFVWIKNELYPALKNQLK